MKTKVTFKGALGDELAGKLDAPENPKAYVLFAHCFTCNKDLNTINRISQGLNEEGIGLFRFDFTGLGKSNGDFANTNFSSNVQDLVSAANFMRDEYEAPAILMGHSFGGTAVLAASAQIPEAKAVATIGSPADTAHVQHNFHNDIAEIKEKGFAEVELVGRKFKIKKQFIDDIESQNMDEHIKNLNKALLVMHSPVDQTVNIENARIIYETAKHPKSFISLDDADHLLMKNSADGVYVSKILSAWASRYIA
ncbi:MAG: lysophospholipase [Rickettsiales bacterium]|nr:lysophospholipase [Rickettsiales bacterium]